MKTEREKPDYKLPDDCYRLERYPVRLMADGIRYVLLETSLAECITMHRKAPFLGAPTCYAITAGRVTFAPVPDAEYEIVFTYLPTPKDW